jgi:hypothetical protein
MTEVLHANIFFFIASVATVAFAILVCIAMYQVVKILASIRALLERIEAGSDMIAEDITTMRNFVVRGGLISHLVGMVTGTRKSARAKSAKKDVTNDDTE